ncbi:sigma-54-dependent Fis family transcriptional regulator [Candidatus Poribacteria bacterium]|nr:sigma-54-dependent Fis family transcriptional regulator [Candidatus Poribacteria bacterium]
MKVLVVDDEKIKLITLRDDLREANYDTIAVESPAIGLQLVQNEHFDVLVTDLRLPKMHGIEFLKRVQKEQPHIIVIVMTAYASVETAVEAMKFGAYNYIKKPFSSEELIQMLDKLKMLHGRDKQRSQLKVPVKGRSPYHYIIGKSQAIQDLFDLLENVSDTQSTVLIYGEHGTGKTLVAKSIHFNSARRLHPFRIVSCSGMSTETLDRELFGDKQTENGFGRKGTLFLQDIDALPIALQVKFLRALEGQQLNLDRSAQREDVRIIAATTKNLRAKVQIGEFRDDLFYRLNVVPIFLPPLRERVEDIPLLINHFLDLFSPNTPIHIAPEVVEVLAAYPWPGNVRELENVIERLVTVGDRADITIDDIPLELKLPVQVSLDETLSEISFQEIIRSTERELIGWAMKKAKGNKTQAAKLLKMKPSTFRDTLAKYLDQIEWQA